MKIFKWILISVAGLAVIFFGAVIIYNMSGKMDTDIANQKSKVKRTMGKNLAFAAYSEMLLKWSETGIYPEKEALLASLSQGGVLSSESYQIKLATDDPEVAKLCPDCEIKKDTFKLALVGNIDNDAGTDILTVDQDNKIILVQDDVGDTGP